jgi:hypothetical protein
MTISLMDSDLVEGMTRAILALHQEHLDADGYMTCRECHSIFPCPTVRIIASFQEAGVHRVASPPELTVVPEVMARGEHTHDFKYPECPEFSGGICDRHHGRALHPTSLPRVVVDKSIPYVVTPESLVP